MSMDKFASAGQCTAGLSCAYTQTISWRSPTMPLPMENNPRAVFERLFGDSGSAAPEARLARVRQSKSILDSVAEKLTDLQRHLGPQWGGRSRSTRTRFATWNGVFSWPNSRVRSSPRSSKRAAARPPREFETYLDLMFDLQLLALQSDLTRVVTFMMGREQSTRTYPQVGVPDAHHPLSHHDNVPERVAQMSKLTPIT